MIVIIDHQKIKSKYIFILSNISKEQSENKIDKNINSLFNNWYVSPIKPVVNDFLRYHLNNYNYKYKNESRIHLKNIYKMEQYYNEMKKC